MAGKSGLGNEQRNMRWRVSSLAAELGREYQGQDKEITGCNTLEEAGPEQLSFLAYPKYTDLLSKTRAGAVILQPDLAENYEHCILSPDPYLDFVRAAQFFAEPQGSFRGISNQSFIDPSARIAEDVTIYPFTFIGAEACIGSGSTLFSGVYIGEGCRIGDFCVLYPQVTLMSQTQVGHNVIIHAGTVLGSDGFGYASHEQGLEKMPQRGKVVIEDDVEIGSNCSIDRATFGETRIGRGTKVDNLVQVGHNVQVDEHCVLVSQVGIAGSSSLGKGVMLGGQVGVSGHLHIGDGCRVGAKSGINKSLPAGCDVTGYPAIEHRKFLRLAALQPKLPEIHNKLKKMESELQELRTRLNSGGEPENGRSI